MANIKPRQFDAYLYIADAMIASQAQQIIDSAQNKKLPTMFHDQALVAGGALASYGQSYFEIGRRSARYVQSPRRHRAGRPARRDRRRCRAGV